MKSERERLDRLYISYKVTSGELCLRDHAAVKQYKLIKSYIPITHETAFLERK